MKLFSGEQFVWTLKWSHIHLFGMGMIFIFMGVISLLLAAHTRRWRFCRDICLCVPASVVGDVGHIPTTTMILLS